MHMRMFYVPVNNFSFISERFPVFLGKTSTKQRIKCFARGHSTVTPLVASADPERGGGAGGPDPPPWKITSYMGFYRE